MKNKPLFETIVVPVDFSKTSENAMWYAAGLALKQKSRLLLLHVHQFPLVNPEPSGAITLFDDIEEAITGLLAKLCTRLREKYGKRLRAGFAFRYGNIEEEIDKFVRNKKASLVVIGNQGIHHVAERLFGNTSSRLISKLKCPVLSVGKNIKYKTPKVIAVAYDYKPLKKTVIDSLKNFSQVFKSHICIVHVAPDTSELPNKEHAKESMRIQKIIGEKSVTFYYISHVDLTLGMKKFMSGKNADMIAMFPGSHNFFSRLWSEPDSRKMSYRTKVPLLTIHK